MIKLSIIAFIRIGSAVTYGTYKYFQSKKTNLTNDAPNYKASILNMYVHTIHSRLYENKIKNPTYYEIINGCKRDITPNYTKLKEKIVYTVKDYMKYNKITQDQLIIKTNQWATKLEIESNNNDSKKEILLLEIDL